MKRQTRLALVRHAYAGQRRDDVSAAVDAQRELTAEGRAEFERAAPGLVALLKGADLFATSALARAAQTAHILAKHARFSNAEPWRQLEPDAEAGEAFERLTKAAPRFAVLVGHEPSLSRIGSLLLTGRKRRVFELEKGGACLLELKDGWKKDGRARLVWLAGPALLAKG